MFNFFNKSEEYLKQIKNLEERLAATEKLLRAEYKKSNLPIEPAEYEFDFDNHNIDVFSVERSGDKTIIGYFIKPNEDLITKEWYFYCDITTHNQLVEKFRKHLERKESNA